MELWGLVVKSSQELQTSTRLLWLVSEPEGRGFLENRIYKVMQRYTSTHACLAAWLHGCRLVWTSASCLTKANTTGSNAALLFPTLPCPWTQHEHRLVRSRMSGLPVVAASHYYAITNELSVAPHLSINLCDKSTQRRSDIPAEGREELTILQMEAMFLTVI